MDLIASSNPLIALKVASLDVSRSKSLSSLKELL